MIQTVIVTVVAMSALAVIVRRYSSTWLPAAFRPVRRQDACDSCPLVAGDAVARKGEARLGAAAKPPA